MYLPLDYWRLIEADASLVGPRGGRQVTFKNVGRYLDNTGFVALVANAWVGTTVAQSLVLESVIREVIESGRALTIAVKTGDEKPPSPDVPSIYEMPPEAEEQHILFYSH